MKKYLVLATLFLLSSYAQAANVTWYGSAGWRYSKATQSDGTTTQGTIGSGATAITASTSERRELAHKFRGELGATGGWDNVEWGIGIRTNGSASNAMPNTNGLGATVVAANSDWTTVSGARDIAIGFNKMWFKYGNDWGFGDVGITFGRQSPVFATGKGQIFVDQDVSLDGLGWTWKWGSFGFNAAQYVLGAVQGGTAGSSSYTATDLSSRSPSTYGGMSVLYSFQPTFNWKFTDELSAMFAVGYHQWSNTVGTTFQNLIPNGGSATTGFGSTSTSGLTTVGAAGTCTNSTGAFACRVSQENSRMWQFLMDWSLPYMFRVNAEWIMNKDQFYAVPHNPGAVDGLPIGGAHKQDKNAWSGGISYGSMKKAHDFMIGYTYHDKGLGAAHNVFTYDKVQAGFKGHEICAGYNLANNFHVSGKALFLKEKNLDNQISQTAGRGVTTNYWEIATGVKF